MGIKQKLNTDLTAKSFEWLESRVHFRLRHYFEALILIWAVPIIKIMMIPQNDLTTFVGYFFGIAGLISVLGHSLIRRAVQAKTKINLDIVEVWFMLGWSLIFYLISYFSTLERLSISIKDTPLDYLFIGMYIAWLPLTCIGVIRLFYLLRKKKRGAIKNTSKEELFK